MAIFLTFILYFGSAFLCSYVSNYAFKSTNKYNRRLFKLIIFIIPVLVSTFREKTGTDSEMYIKTYENFQMISSKRWNDFEIGFKFIIELLNRLGASYHMLFFLMSSILVGCTLLFIDNEKENINVKVSVFIFMTDLYLIGNNIMRQATVVAIALYSISIYLDGKRFKSVVLICLSSLIHISGLITLLVIVFEFLVKNKKYKFIIASISVITLFLVINRSLLAIIVMKLTNSAYAMYLTSKVDSGGSLINYIIKYIFPITIFLIYMDEYKKVPKMKVYASLVLMGYIFLLLSIFTGTQVQRIGYSFLYLNIVLFGYISNEDCYVMNKRISKNSIGVLVILYAFSICVVNIFISGFNEVVPYIPFK